MKQMNDVFSTMPVPKAILRNIIPSIVSMIVVLLYNIADTYFVGQTGNPMQVAAVSLTTPVFMLFMAMGNLLGIGGTSVISRAFGAKKPDYARHVSSFCFYSSLGMGVIFAFIFWISMPVILKLIGTSEETIGFARSYLLYIAPSAPFVITATAFSNILRAEGQSTKAMWGMMLGTIVNIILDPFMILTLNLGVVGAALATLIGNVFGTCFYIIYFLRKQSMLSIAPRDFRFGEKIFSNVFSIGTPAALNNVLMSVSFIILNNFIASYGDIPVAAMGVATKVSLIVVILQVGLGIGVQPLFGFNYGANNKERFKEIMKVSILYTVAMGTFLTILCWIGAEATVRAFIDDDAVNQYGAQFVKALIMSGPVLGVLFVLINALQGIGAAKESLILSISRQGLVFLPLLFLLNTLFGLTGIVYTQPVADFLSIAISGTLYIRKIRKWNAEELPNQEHS